MCINVYFTGIFFFIEFQSFALCEVHGLSSVNQHLEAWGFNVHGFDASDHMLEKLRIKANAKNIQPIIWKGFVEDFKRPEKYNLIFIPSGSFCLITELATVKAALKILYDHLFQNYRYST